MESPIIKIFPFQPVCTWPLELEEEELEEELLDEELEDELELDELELDDDVLEDDVLEEELVLLRPELELELEEELAVSLGPLQPMRPMSNKTAVSF